LDFLEYQVVQEEKDRVVIDGYIPVDIVIPKHEDVPLEQEVYEHLYTKWMHVMYKVQDCRPGPGFKEANYMMDGIGPIH
jgi:hypothetical protein